MADETKCMVCDMPLYQHGAGTNCIRYLMERVDILENALERTSMELKRVALETAILDNCTIDVKRRNELFGLPTVGSYMRIQTPFTNNVTFVYHFGKEIDVEGLKFVLIPINDGSWSITDPTTGMKVLGADDIDTAIAMTEVLVKSRGKEKILEVIEKARANETHPMPEHPSALNFNQQLYEARQKGYDAGYKDGVQAGMSSGEEHTVG